MPIYGYQCETCGHRFDHLQRLSEDDPTDCPSCGAAQTLRRELSAPQFRLKGGGWYETDFKSDSDKKRNLAESPSSEASSAKTESAPAADSKTSNAETAPAATPPAAPSGTQT